MIQENKNDDSSSTSETVVSEALVSGKTLETAHVEEIEKEDVNIDDFTTSTTSITNSTFADPVIHPTVDRPRIERAVREILAAVGEDPDREGLLETPKRVAKMYEELLHGLQEDPRIHLRKFFTEQYDEIVLVRDISFSSMCEHHLLPFFGKAHIAYLPKGRIIGLSKLARLVDSVARRPQVQERMTEQIANLLTQELDVLGVAVIIEAEHTCMTIRGIRRPGSRCVTSAVRGRFRSDARSRAEVMALIYSGQTPVK